MVTFRQDRRLFTDFEGGMIDFKERFLLVRPQTEVALSNVLKTVERPHVRGGVASTRIPHFNFFWYLDHFEYKPKFYECKYSRLSSQDKLGYDKIRRFVESFHPAGVINEDGNRKLDSQGSLVTVPRAIDTQSLVFSLSPAELLGSRLVYLFFRLCFNTFIFCRCIVLLLQERCQTCTQICVPSFLRQIRRLLVRVVVTVSGMPDGSGLRNPSSR